MNFRCAECDLTFATRSKRDLHYKSKHQDYVDVVFPNGRKHGIKRSNDGKFTCLCERATYDNPRSLLKHCSLCLNIPPNDNATSDFAAVSADNDSVQPDTKADLEDDLISHSDLESMNYVINKRIGLVICRSCKVALSPGSEIDHLKRVHRRKITVQVKVTLSAENANHVFGIRSSLADLDAYLRPSPEPLEPLAGLPVITGFQCVLCSERAYCCSTKTHMKSHLRDEHQSANFDASARVQAMQRLLNRVPKHCMAYFPVNRPQTGERELLPHIKG